MADTNSCRPVKNLISRRQFIRSSAAGAAALWASCGKKSNPSGPDNTELGNADVALRKLANYDYSSLKRTVESMLNNIGGLSDIIQSGDKVAMKINLTGGDSWVEDQLGCRAEDSIWTHSSVIRVIGEMVRDAGAAQIYVVESGGEGVIQNPRFGYLAAISALGAQYINLNSTAPYPSYVSLQVVDPFNFPEFRVNPILSEIDAYISIAKMKCHYTAGITLSMKNNVGMVPGSLYSGSGGGGTRWGLHGPGGELTAAGWHLPRTIVDLNQARPVNLAVIDGISTMDKGEGSWVPHFVAPYPAHALLIGKDAVKTDAIGMQVMGFYPLSAHYTGPFVVSENWLLRAEEKNVGDPDPSNITVAGDQPDDFSLQFHACDKNPDVVGKTARHLIPYFGQHPDDQYRL
jgi:uncharacterized protein (DUF362 family)